MGRMHYGIWPATTARGRRIAALIEFLWGLGVIGYVISIFL
jgi:hypothetical protein